MTKKHCYFVRRKRDKKRLRCVLQNRMCLSGYLILMFKIPL